MTCIDLYINLTMKDPGVSRRRITGFLVPSDTSHTEDIRSVQQVCVLSITTKHTGIWTSLDVQSLLNSD